MNNREEWEMKRLRGGQGRKDSGLTFIELIMVITIIAVLAALSVPNYISYRQRAYNTSASADAVNAMRAYMSYRTSKPNTMCDADTLKSYGFTPTEHVTTELSFTPDADNPVVRSNHTKGTRYYYVHSDGAINVTNM